MAIGWTGICLQEVAQFTAECEKFVGTESGGMDQAISIMGELGLAKLVHFNPVTSRPYQVQAGAVMCRRLFTQHLLKQLVAHAACCMPNSFTRAAAFQGCFSMSHVFCALH